MTTLVLGAGAIGMLTAYNLAHAGEPVILLDKGDAGQESSWAGGGIVSPLYPWRYSPAVTALAHWSQDFYPGLGERLYEESGVDPEVHETGLYWLELDDEADALAWAKRYERDLHRVDMDKVYRKVPELAQGYQRAIYMPGVANIRNPRLVRSLRAALLQLDNVDLRENCPVERLLIEDGDATGVVTATGEIRADRVVVAAGAWSSELLAPLGIELPVEPVKGQMILYKCAEDFLPTMLLAAGRYAIPRRDGHILVGSTLEYTGFDKSTSEEALESLKQSAHDLLPALAQAEVVKQWAGLRPGSPEGVPFIGPVAGIDGLWLNCGHFSNGLVLAPASCQLLADLLLDRQPEIDPAPYAPVNRL